MRHNARACRLSSPASSPVAPSPSTNLNASIRQPASASIVCSVPSCRRAIPANRWSSLYRPRAGIALCSGACVEEALRLGLISREKRKGMVA